MRQLLAMGALTFVLAGCVAGTGSPYDPDWDANGPIADGKADGFSDMAPELTMGQPAEGDVGGTNTEIFRIELRRGDRIEVVMEVLQGDLNPHLSLFLGTSTYVDSETWSRQGNVLRKVYAIEEAGMYLLAARAYRGEGSGRYRLTVSCVGGTCAGELPEPEGELDLDQAAECIQQARRCAFAELPTYGGRVAETRANEIFTACLGRAALEDGTSCQTACSAQGGDANRGDDDAAGLCTSITQSLAFYADQTAACLAVLDGCFAGCYDAAGDESGGAESVYETVEARCWQDGYNGSCDSYARSHEACGGTIRAGSAAEYTASCHATTGAHVDDLDTLCSSDIDCESYCEVDIAQAGESCGGVSAEHEECLSSFLDDNQAGVCADALQTAIGG
jgi:hypothetical protein